MQDAIEKYRAAKAAHEGADANYKKWAANFNAAWKECRAAENALEAARDALVSAAADQ